MGPPPLGLPDPLWVGVSQIPPPPQGSKRSLAFGPPQVTQVWTVKKVYSENYVKHIQGCVQRVRGRAGVAWVGPPLVGLLFGGGGRHPLLQGG